MQQTIQIQIKIIYFTYYFLYYKIMEENVDTMKWHNNVASRSFPIIFRLFAFGEPLGGHVVPTESASRRNIKETCKYF